VFVWWSHAMYTPTRIAGREAVFEFLRQKLRAYQIIYKDHYMVAHLYFNDPQIL